MPFAIRKAPGKNKYWVINKITGKHYSTAPLSKEIALRQLHALYLYTGGK